MLFKIKSNPMHPLRSALPLPYVRRVLLVVLSLLIGTRSLLLVVGLLSIAEALFPSLWLFGTILVTLCLDGRDLRVSRAEPMLSCWHDPLFLFCLLLFYLLRPSMYWLCGVGVFGLTECSHSRPALHSGLQILIIIGPQNSRTLSNSLYPIYISLLSFCSPIFLVTALQCSVPSK